MRRHILILFIVSAVLLPCRAQTEAEDALRAYDFPRAEQLLEKEITKLSRRRQPTDCEEEMLRYARLAQRKMSAVERVVVFDSVVVSRAQTLAALCVSDESGVVCLTSDYAGLPGGDCTLFRPQMADRVYYSAPNATGVSQLFSAVLFGSDMADAEPLRGLDDEQDTPHDYPYMMADGQTLYFAMQGDDGLGGYDIYMTRFDEDDRRFLAPENVGMPFNSPANDYLLCIDEPHNVGCFVTDRGMSPDSVCVYYFIPNASRCVYIEEEVGEERLRDLARLSDISLTWGAETQVSEAKGRLAECMREQAEERKPDFTLVIADGRTCHWLTDFRNREAQALAQKWLQDRERLAQSEALLSEMRDGYMHADSTRRTLMRAQILKAEADAEALAQDIRTQEKAIRRAELGI